MDVIGVDPSLTCTGLARTWPSVELTTERVRTTAPGSDDLADVRDRVRFIVGAVLKFAPDRCLTIIEAPIIPRGHSGGQVLERAWLFGMLVDQLMLRGPVIRVRQATRAMYATGNGRATKREVRDAMRRTFPSVDVPDDNVADALALMAMGARWRGSPVDGDPSKKQLEAIRAVHWPEMKEKH